MEVLIFKTNIIEEAQVYRIKSLLSNVKSVCEWNLDLDDCDRILRVVAPGLQPRFIESLLETSGIYCQELED